MTFPSSLQSLTFHSLLALILGLGSWSPAGAAEPQQRIIATFENSENINLQGYRAQFRRVASGSGHQLQITTEGDADYPSVEIKANDGPWDLRGFHAVCADVVNPQDHAVRVLLSVNNPGANGRERCNVESVTVAGGGKATLRVPFGVWHGEKGHDLDLARIVSVSVLLDRPGRAHTFFVDNIRAIARDDNTFERLAKDAFFQEMTPELGRGINLGNMLDAPQEGAWGARLKAEYFPIIKNAGFDHVRLPVRWSAHAANDAPYTIDPEFLQRVDWAVKNALDNRLKIVVNMHHYDEIFDDPASHAGRFVALWRQISEHYAKAPPDVYFELLNEPHNKLDADRWNDLLAQTLAEVRKTNPRRKIIIGPTGWNSINELTALRLPPDDRNLIVTFHYYSPFRFTHQGASWVGGHSNQWLGTRWTGSEEELGELRSDLDRALAWALANKRPLYLGEFGAYSKADMPSRARYTAAVAREAWKRRISYAYWEFCAGFGAFDPERKQWRAPLRDALSPVGR